MPKGYVHQPIRLPGQFEDELTGIVQNRFREYTPLTGRYVTTDPLAVQGKLIPYRYTRNPVDYIDPLGLSYEKAVTTENAVEAEEAITRSQATPTGIIAPLEPNYYTDSFTGRVINQLFGGQATDIADVWRKTFGDERYLGINPLTGWNEGYRAGTDRFFDWVPLPAAKSAKVTGDVASGISRSSRELSGNTRGILGPNAGSDMAATVTSGGNGQAIAGHGFFRFGDGSAIVPEGTTLVLPRGGIKITDAAGRVLESIDVERLANSGPVAQRRLIRQQLDELGITHKPDKAASSF